MAELFLTNYHDIVNHLVAQPSFVRGARVANIGLISNEHREISGNQSFILTVSRVTRD